MNKARWIFRFVFFLLTVTLLVYINRKSNDNTMSIVEFKYKTFKKIETDSLDANANQTLAKMALAVLKSSCAEFNSYDWEIAITLYCLRFATDFD